MKTLARYSLVITDVDPHDSLRWLVVKASRALEGNPSLISTNYLGDTVVTVPLPSGYKPRMNRFATHLRGRCSMHGLFAIDEVGGNVSGGWVGSCMPLSIIRQFLAAVASRGSAQLELAFSFHQPHMGA